MEGRPLAERIRAQVAAEVGDLGQIGLATVQVGEDEASTIYLRLKHRAAAEVEIASVDHKVPHDLSEDEVLALVAELNGDDAIDGILVQLPLPDHIDEARVIAAVDPVKDVDGFHPFNAGQLYLGRPTHVPATPLGVLALLAEYGIALDGARAVVDVGINRTEEGLVGDVDPDAATRAAFLTPVPGGVGPMTIAMLLQNTVRAARYRRGVLAFPQAPR